MNKKIFITITILLILGVVLASRFFSKTANSQFDSFAQCLSDKGIVMYGADWCPHCQNEKKAFGDSFRLVSYVECTDDPKKCLAAGINAYPTWLFPDGKKLEGEQGLKKLSSESGCIINN